MIAAIVLAAAVPAAPSEAPVYCNTVDAYGRVGSYEIGARRADDGPWLSFKALQSDLPGMNVTSVRDAIAGRPGESFKFDAMIGNAPFEGNFGPEVTKAGQETWTFQIDQKAGDRRGLIFLSGICGRKANFTAAYSGKKTGEIVSETKCYGVTLKGQLFSFTIIPGADAPLTLVADDKSLWEGGSAKVTSKLAPSINADGVFVSMSSWSRADEHRGPSATTFFTVNKASLLGSFEVRFWDIYDGSHYFVDAGSHAVALCGYRHIESRTSK